METHVRFSLFSFASCDKVFFCPPRSILIQITPAAPRSAGWTPVHPVEARPQTSPQWFGDPRGWCLGGLGVVYLPAAAAAAFPPLGLATQRETGPTNRLPTGPVGADRQTRSQLWEAPTDGGMFTDEL